MGVGNHIVLIIILMTIALSFLSTLITVLDQNRRTKKILDGLVSSADEVAKGVNATVGEINRGFSKTSEKLVFSILKVITSFSIKVVAKMDLIISFISKFIFVVLLAALLFTSVLLVQGFQHPEQLDYVVGMATLIVSVVTVFSILVAYYEFTSRRKK
ncbi:hypothetical protein HCA63_06590 [Listeria booriae]|uniref:hypothetical protein n=1 Tax=Listeria booriae TaxID=1552123 RepID=UPI00162AC36C|nr:hypothetical protein [Listeria booriae]MBC1888016.1 hypothetical protein [Listeria booriae]